VGNVQPRVALMFGGIAMAAAYLGARAAALVSGQVQLTLLAIAMLAASVSMFRSGRAATATEERAASSETPHASFGLVMLVSVGVGLLTGLVGIGGGFLVVPALVLLARLPMKQAIGTSLVVIAMNAFSGFAGYLGQVTIPWGFVSLFTAVAVAGIVAGTHLVRFVSPGALKQGFAALLVVLGIMILIRNH